MSDLLAARLQMAFTLGFHIIFACLGVGLPVLLLYAEWRALRGGDPLWYAIARRWSKAFAVLFAVGAVSGTVLSFELGLLWPGLMGTFGSVMGLPFTLEGFAFFTEGIFIGIYLYGWDRLSPRAHFLSGIPIAIAGFAGAFLVVTANAWMNTPVRFRLENGVVVDADPIAAMTSPAAGAQAVHMVLAAYIVTGFIVATVYATARLRGRDTPYARRCMAMGLAMGAALAPLQAVAGDWAAKVVARTQPAKLAAMEGQFATEKGAPLRVGGIPDEEARVTRYALDIPKGLSWLAHGDPDATVVGLDAFPRDEQPPVLIVHLAFQVMVAGGGALALLGLVCAASLAWKRRLPEGRLFLVAVLASGPVSVLALLAGWVVTEVGRQPWVVQGVMRTSEAVTAAPGLKWTLAGSLAIYAILTAGMIAVLRNLARAPLPPEAELPEKPHGA
jgi:cytochrome d ubiquinol oxidase subunit I